jgi:hypothetical protein
VRLPGGRDPAALLGALAADGGEVAPDAATWQLVRDSVAALLERNATLQRDKRDLEMRLEAAADGADGGGHGGGARSTRSRPFQLGRGRVEFAPRTTNVAAPMLGSPTAEDGGALSDFSAGGAAHHTYNPAAAGSAMAFAVGPRLAAARASSRGAAARVSVALASRAGGLGLGSSSRRPQPPASERARATSTGSSSDGSRGGAAAAVVRNPLQFAVAEGESDAPPAAEANAQADFGAAGYDGAASGSSEPVTAAAE